MSYRLSYNSGVLPDPAPDWDCPSASESWNFYSAKTSLY